MRQKINALCATLLTFFLNVASAFAQNSQAVEFYATPSNYGLGFTWEELCRSFVDDSPMTDIYHSVIGYDGDAYDDNENSDRFRCYTNTPLVEEPLPHGAALWCGVPQRNPSQDTHDYGKCPPNANPPPTCRCIDGKSLGDIHIKCPVVGNPISVLSGVKVEVVTDWVSSIDPRFSIERMYRNLTTSADFTDNSFGENWGSLFDHKIRKKRSSTTRSTLYRFDGSVFYFARVYRSGWKEIPTEKNHSTEIDAALHNYNLRVDVSSEGGRSILTSGDGRVEVYSDTPGTYNAEEWSYLEEVRWPDGYILKFERDEASNVTAIEDNRGQRAEVTTTSTVISNQMDTVVSQIEIDTSFDGVTFDSDLSLEYSYAGVGEVGKVINTSILVRASVTNQIVAQRGYNYSGSNLTGINDGRVDSSGQTFDYATFDYDGARAIQSMHAGGVDDNKVSEPVDVLGGIAVSVLNPLGKETIYTFAGEAGRERIVSVEGVATTNCLPSNSTISYDSVTQRMMEVVHRNGARTVYVRDSEGRVLTKTEDADGLAPRVTSYTWGNNTFRKPLTRTTSELKETFVYDADGLLVSYSQEDVFLGSPDFGNVRTWTYSFTTLPNGLKVLTALDGPGLLADGIDDVTIYEYDAVGRVSKVTDPAALVQEVLAFGPTGQPSLIKDQKSYEWELEYDLLGRLIKSTFDPNGVDDETTYQYDIAGQMTASTDALNRTTTYLYSEAKRLVQIVSPSGDTIDFEYDAMGNLTRTEYSDQSATLRYLEQTQYDELGRILQALGSNGQTMSFAHDVEDNLISETDAIGLQSTKSYDALNRFSELVDRASYTTTLEHDEDDQLTRFIDPRGIETTMVYNGFGELVSETSADRGLMTYTYDDRGLATSMTDARGIVINYTYDNAGRLTSKVFPSDASLDQQFNYYGASPTPSRNGDLQSVSDQTGQSNYASDLTRGALSLMSLQIEGQIYDVAFETEAEGQLVHTEYPSGSQVLPVYNNDGELTKLQWRAWNLTTNGYLPAVDVIKDMTYLPFGPLKSASYGDAATLLATYDSSYRLTGLTDTYAGSALRDETYNWTTRDNLAGVTDNLDPLNTQTFTYSSREKLTRADGVWGELDYAYDGVGNRVSMTATQAGLTSLDLYNYPTDSNKLMDIVMGSGGLRTLTYDAAGNVTYDNRNGQGYGYNYDAAGRMSSFAINGVIQAEYEYDYQGHQVVRRLTQLGQTIHNIFDADGQRIAEYLYDDTTGTSSLIREYIWANGALVGVYENGTLYFVRTDHIGRPVFATDDTGAKVWEASYLPFGGVVASSGPNADLRFPGQWFQSESGLHQNWMRDYDPTLGRYIQADPLGLVDGASVYGYVNQNPGRFIDPMGLAQGDRGDFDRNRPRNTGSFGRFLAGYKSYYRGLARCQVYCNTPEEREASRRILDKLLNNPQIRQCLLEYLKENTATALGRFSAGSANTVALTQVLGPIGTAAGLSTALGAAKGDIGYYAAEAARLRSTLTDRQILEIILSGERNTSDLQLMEICGCELY